jgi:hypothetical protein
MSIFHLGFQTLAKNIAAHDKLILTSGHKKNNFNFVTVNFIFFCILQKNNLGVFFVFQIYETNETKIP